MPKKTKDDYEASDESDNDDESNREVELVSEDSLDSDQDSDVDDEEDADEEDADAEDEEDADDEPLVDLQQDKNQPKFANSDYYSPFCNILSINEKTAIIGFRAAQLAAGADIYVETYANDTPFSIAKRELLEQKIPFYLKRRLPDGNFISVKLDDLLDVNP